MFVFADRDSGDRYVIPSKGVTESTIRLLLADMQQASLTVLPTAFVRTNRLMRIAQSPMNTLFTAMASILIETFTSIAARATRRLRDGGSRRLEESQRKVHTLSSSVSVRREMFRKPWEEALKTIIETPL